MQIIFNIPRYLHPCPTRLLFLKLYQESLRRPSYSVWLASMSSFLQLSLNSSIPFGTSELSFPRTLTQKALFFYEKGKEQNKARAHIHLKMRASSCYFLKLHMSVAHLLPRQLDLVWKWPERGCRKRNVQSWKNSNFMQNITELKLYAVNKWQHPEIWVLLQNCHPENAALNFQKYTNYLIGLIFW